MTEFKEWLDSKSGLKVAICDTNIWYKPDLIKLFREKHPNIKLVATYLNLYELSLSNRIISDFESVRSAIVTLFEEHDEIIDIHPLSHFLSIKDQENLFLPFKDEIDKIRLIFESILNGDSLNKQRFEEIIVLRKNSLDKCTAYFNEKLFNNKTIVKNELRANKYGYWQFDTLNVLEDSTRLANALISGGINQLNGCSFDYQIELSNDSLFLCVLNEYYRELLAEGNRKMHNNDWIDLMNLSYMIYGDYYFTDEKKWLKIINKLGYSEKLITLD